MSHFHAPALLIAVLGILSPHQAIAEDDYEARFRAAQEKFPILSRNAEKRIAGINDRLREVIMLHLHDRCPGVMQTRAPEVSQTYDDWYAGATEAWFTIGAGILAKHLELEEIQELAPSKTYRQALSKRVSGERLDVTADALQSAEGRLFGAEKKFQFKALEQALNDIDPCLGNAGEAINRT